MTKLPSARPRVRGSVQMWTAKLEGMAAHSPWRGVQVKLWVGTETGSESIDFTLWMALDCSLTFKVHLVLILDVWLVLQPVCCHIHSSCCTVSSHFFDGESLHQFKTVSTHGWLDSAEMHNKHTVAGACPISPAHPQDNASECSELAGKMTLFPFPPQSLTYFCSCASCNHEDMEKASKQTDKGEKYLVKRTLQDTPQPNLATEAFQAWTKCHECNDVFLRQQAAQNNRLRPVPNVLSSGVELQSLPAGFWISTDSHLWGFCSSSGNGQNSFFPSPDQQLW